MTPDPLVDSLVADLKPVSPRRWPALAVPLLLLFALEAVLVTMVIGMRPDMGAALLTARFWWKAGALLAIGGVGLVVALRSLDPAISPRRGLRMLAGLAAALLALGWLIDAAGAGPGALLARLDRSHGLGCVAETVTMALPMLVAVGLVLRQGAPSRPAGTGLAAGVAAAALGGLAYLLACPHDEPLYVAVWYGGSVAALALVARLVLPRLIRW